MTKNKKTLKSNIFVSIVMSTPDKHVDLLKYITELSDTLRSNYFDYEVIIVDNGTNPDGIKDVINLLSKIPCLRIITLSQHEKYDTAIFAGLDSAIGDYVCTLNPAVDSIDLIHKIIKENQENHAVQGVSSTPILSAFGTQLGRRLFYWYNRKYIGIDIPLNATHLASYSRAVINSLTTTKRGHSHVRHLVRVIGYQPIQFMYEPMINPANKRTLKTGVIEALEIATSYSTHPLRFVTWLGFFAGLANIIYAVYVVIVNLTKDTVMEGWTTTSLQLSGMFFILFIIMVILAEYIGRALVEGRHESQYYVSDEKSSAVGLSDISRRNIEK